MAHLLTCVALLFITACVPAVYTSDLPSPFLEAVNRLKLKSKISYLRNRITQLKDHGNELPSGRLRKRQSYACIRAYQESESPYVQQCLPYLANEGSYTSNSQIGSFCRLGCDRTLKRLFTDLQACEPDSTSVRSTNHGYISLVLKIVVNYVRLYSLIEFCTLNIIIIIIANKGFQKTRQVRGQARVIV